jgi:hypothetical protein
LERDGELPLYYSSWFAGFRRHGMTHQNAASRAAQIAP